MVSALKVVTNDQYREQTSTSSGVVTALVVSAVYLNKTTQNFFVHVILAISLARFQKLFQLVRSNVRLFQFMRKFSVICFFFLLHQMAASAIFMTCKFLFHPFSLHSVMLHAPYFNNNAIDPSHLF